MSFRAVDSGHHPLVYDISVVFGTFDDTDTILSRRLPKLFGTTDSILVPIILSS